jgi:hypothetical protein
VRDLNESRELPSVTHGSPCRAFAAFAAFTVFAAFAASAAFITFAAFSALRKQLH